MKKPEQNESERPESSAERAERRRRAKRDQARAAETESPKTYIIPEAAKIVELSETTIMNAIRSVEYISPQRLRAVDGAVAYRLTEEDIAYLHAFRRLIVQFRPSEVRRLKQIFQLRLEAERIINESVRGVAEEVGPELAVQLLQNLWRISDRITNELSPEEQHMLLVFQEEMSRIKL